MFAISELSETGTVENKPCNAWPKNMTHEETAANILVSFIY